MSWRNDKLLPFLKTPSQSLCTVIGRRPGHRESGPRAGELRTESETLNVELNGEGSKV
ncbi:hypothetical protein RUND412_002717 [Rhizina undulata]